jgi:hypothetical protein
LGENSPQAAVLEVGQKATAQMVDGEPKAGGPRGGLGATAGVGGAKIVEPEVAQVATTAAGSAATAAGESKNVGPMVAPGVKVSVGGANAAPKVNQAAKIDPGNAKTVAGVTKAGGPQVAQAAKSVAAGAKTVAVDAKAVGKGRCKLGTFTCTAHNKKIQVSTNKHYKMRSVQRLCLASPRYLS